MRISWLKLRTATRHISRYSDNVLVRPLWRTDMDACTSIKSTWRWTLSSGLREIHFNIVTTTTVSRVPAWTGKRIRYDTTVLKANYDTDRRWQIPLRWRSGRPPDCAGIWRRHLRSILSSLRYGRSLPPVVRSTTPIRSWGRRPRPTRAASTDDRDQLRC